jgi:dipeptidyl aminopeptidase/acylaminoacyl peptidase
MTKRTERINTHLGDLMLAVSPNGRYVIVSRAVTEVPKIWERYEPGVGTRRIAAVSPERLKLAEDIDIPEEMVLVDLETGANSALVDAPLGRDVQYLGPTDASWSPDGRSVMLTNLMLPLDGNTEAEQNERMRAAYIVLLDLQTHSWTPIVGLKQYGPKDLYSWWPEKIQTDWLHGELTVRYRAHGPAPETYKVDKGRWILTATSREAAGETSASPIEIVVRQDLNTPPALFVDLKGTADYRLIWDPNPQFKDIVFGHVESYSWKDGDGREVRGVLIKPPAFQDNRQYSLVIEARSYRQDRFVVDGTYATAVAAQAMAGGGLMVLQAGEPAVLQGESFRKGTAVALEGYKAVIAKLAGENLVNLQRVGIIGFSRTCDNVMYAVTQAPSLFAAATIANGFTYSVMGFLEMVDATTDNAAMKQWSLHYGGNPLGAAIEAYKRENVLFNLHQVATPIRVETHDSRNILTDWETYAGLRSLNKPVDLGMLPYSTHVVSMPSDVVDIAIELEARMTEDAAFRMWCDARRKLAVRRGTHFNSTVDLVLWPRTEIFRALRARARALSLHEWNQVARIPGVRYRILMGDRERIVSLITGGECVDA